MRAVGHDPPLSAANEVWAYDFVFDACADGRQVKCLTIIDEWSREWLAIDPGASIRSGRSQAKPRPHHTMHNRAVDAPTHLLNWSTTPYQRTPSPSSRRGSNRARRDTVGSRPAMHLSNGAVE